MKPRPDAGGHSWVPAQPPAGRQHWCHGRAHPAPPTGHCARPRGHNTRAVTSRFDASGRCRRPLHHRLWANLAGAAAAPGRPSPGGGGGAGQRAGAGSGGHRLRPVHRPDPHLAGRGRAGGRGDHRPGARRDRLAGLGPADRQRRGAHHAGAGHRTRRLVEHEGLADLRRHCGRGGTEQVRHPGGGSTAAEPLQRGAGGGLSAVRLEPGRPPGPVVGADDPWVGPDLRRHPGRRPGAHPTVGHPAGGGAVPGHLDGRAGRGRGHGPRHDGPVARWAGDRLELVVGHRHLARAAGIPVLHDHRPADGRQGAGGRGRLRRRRGPAGRRPHGRAEHRVRHQGGAAGCLDGGLCVSAAHRTPHSGASGRGRFAAGCCRLARPTDQPHPPEAGRGGHGWRGSRGRSGAVRRRRLEPTARR